MLAGPSPKFHGTRDILSVPLLSVTAGTLSVSRIERDARRLPSASEAVALHDVRNTMSSPESAPPPGWYSDGSGEGLRWWNGREWTEHRNGPAPTQPVPASVWEGIRPPITPPSYWSARFPNGVTAGDILALIVIAVVLFLVIYYMFLP
jgi:hypothetical protein